ncbi:FecR family protein [Parapedobacter indicus]|uniref:FecR family protein n=1 Tax=Parapedobacter indicus TaxID=1477437 RepID=A0A1I3TEX9_9SPHI|nr:FecR family protein [Parapedobacter indicus]PPK99528.1 FecR family protein [Parapedobacter indicus]SFJ69043.1 FecR family protein [Parapedobacter indicus]
MTTGEFEKLVERYRLGECTPDEIAFVAKWMEKNAGAAEDDSTVFKNEEEAIRREEEGWNRIQQLAGFKRKTATRRMRNRYWWAAAACVAWVVGGLLFLNRASDSQPELAGLETFNTSANRQRITLPDSSTVVLGEGSSIIISEDYGMKNRVVRLKGEAFFEIVPNPQAPFLVYSADLITEVLGTSFSIKPEAKGKTIEVSVTTGKVSVYAGEKDRNKRRRGVILTTNQKAVYDAESKTIRQDLVDHPKIVETDAPEAVFNFDQTRVKTVLATLRHSYKMEIVVTNPVLNDCLFTGNLNGFDLFQQLNYICDVINAQYEVRGTTIFLTGEGCRAPKE